MNENMNTDNAVDTVNENQEQEQVKTYTEDEVMRLLQSEADKRVSQALATQKKKYEQQLSLSKLDENKRSVAEKDMRIEELETKLREYTLLSNKNEVMKTLSARGLHTDFADLIEIGEDVAVAQQRIDKLDKLFKQAVAAEVKKRLAAGTPKVGTGISDSGEMTKEQFKKLTIAQRSELYTTNPELYKKLSGN